MRPFPAVALAALLAGCPDPPPAPAPQNGGAPRPAPGDADPAPDEPDAPAPVQGYRVVAVYPHDETAFTQGLIYHDGRLYESTGQYGGSSIRRVELATGRVEAVKQLNRQIFAEGLALHDGELVQLSWKVGMAFVRRLEDLEHVRTLRYQGEGWGLASDGERFFRTDGTDRVWFHDPETFEARGSVRVHDAGRPVFSLNELEWIDGELWANVWQQDRIARIDVGTGRVTAWVDLTGIIDIETTYKAGQPDNVLNGIAWDPDGERLFVTGKYWPQLFQIEVVEEPTGG